MHHDKSVTLVVDNLVALTALQSFHPLVLEHIADMLSPQVVAIVENIWLVVAASIVLVFCLVFVMPDKLLLGQDHSLVLNSANSYLFLLQQQLSFFQSGVTARECICIAVLGGFTIMYDKIILLQRQSPPTCAQ